MNRVTDWSEVPLVLSVQEVAAIMGCSRQSVYKMISHGGLEAVSTRGGTRIRKEALIVYLGGRPSLAVPETDPQVIHHLERAQYHHNEAMRLLEVK